MLKNLECQLTCVYCLLLVDRANKQGDALTTL